MSSDETTNESNTRLFVSGFSHKLTEEDIRNHFVSFGAITDIYILKNKKTNKSRGCCFVGFLNKTQASLALKRCNKSYLGARKIDVSFANNKYQKSTQIAASSKASKPVRPKIDTTDDIEDDEQYQQFLRLSTNQTVDTFMNDWDDSDDSDINDITEHEEEEKKVEITEDKKEENADDIDKIVENKDVKEIFIRNLPFITTEEDLYQFFSEYGNISNIFIPLDDFNKVKGYGFIEFDSNDSIQALFKK